MPKKTTFTVPEVPGSKRQSLRPYTHAVIGRRDTSRSALVYAADLVKNEQNYRRHDGKNWDAWARAATATVGQLYKNFNGFMVTAHQSSVDIGTKFIGENPVRQAYIDGMASERQACLHKMQQGEAGELEVLQWSMSQNNAMKAVNSMRNHHSDVSVVECKAV